MSKAKKLIAKLVEGLNPMSNDPEAMRLRIKSMMSYEGYLEYYEAYSQWQKSQGKTAEKPMSRLFFDSRLASMPKSYRQVIVHQAGEWGVEVPRGFFDLDPKKAKEQRKRAFSNLQKLESIVASHKLPGFKFCRLKSVGLNQYIPDEMSNKNLDGDCIWDIYLGYNDEDNSGEFDFVILYAIQHEGQITVHTNLHCPIDYNYEPAPLPLEDSKGQLNPALVTALNNMRWPEQLDDNET